MNEALNEIREALRNNVHEQIQLKRAAGKLRAAAATHCPYGIGDIVTVPHDDPHFPARSGKLTSIGFHASGPHEIIHSWSYEADVTVKDMNGEHMETARWTKPIA